MDNLPNEILFEIGSYIDDCSIIPYTLTSSIIKSLCFKLIPQVYKIKSILIINNAEYNNYYQLINWFKYNDCDKDLDVKLALNKRYYELVKQYSIWYSSKLFQYKENYSIPINLKFDRIYNNHKIIY